MKKLIFAIVAVAAVFALWHHATTSKRVELESRPFAFNAERMVLADSVINQSIADDDLY